MTAPTQAGAAGLPRISGYPMPTRPPANRVGWPLRAERAVLLVHDMQRYFLAAYPADAEPISTARQNIARLRAAARAAGVPVVYTAQPPDQSPEHRALLLDFWGPGLRGGADAEIVDELAPGPDELVLTKWRYSAFQRTELRRLMREWGRDQLVITGVYTHIGCVATAIEAFAHDIQAFLVADASADFDEHQHAAALRYVATRCGRVITTEGSLAELGRPGASGSTALHALCARVADLIGERAEDIDPDENLFDAGLDSVRAMMLVEQLRAEGVEASLADLAGEPTVRAWHTLLAAAADPR